MDPITLFLLGVAVFGGSAAVVAYLTIDHVMDWFAGRRYLLRNRDHVATTVIRLINSGNCRVVQGVFNTATERWVEHRTVEAKRLGAGLVLGTSSYTVH